MACKPEISRSRVASEGNANAATATAPEASNAPTNRNRAIELAPIVAELRAAGAVSLQAVAAALTTNGNYLPCVSVSFPAIFPNSYTICGLGRN